MKNILIILLAFTVCSVSAQISFNTGSVQLDTDLNTINARASVDFDSFKGDLSVSYNISEKKIEYMRGSLNMAPGEVYLALEIARLSNKPIDEIIIIYKSDKSKGWGYIAKKAGIKPGSTEFHQLKNNAGSKKKKAQDKGQAKGKNKK
jgi:hypothetical protein